MTATYVVAAAQSHHDDLGWANALIRPQPWMKSAMCAQTDPDAFFPEASNSVSITRAKAICASCPVIGQCLDYALRNNEKEGVWGGTTEKERHRLRDLLRKQR